MFAAFTLSTALALTPTLAAAAKVLHLGVASVYEDPSLEQFKRLDAQLTAAAGPGEVVSIRNEPMRTKFEAEPVALKDVDAKLTARLNGSTDVFDRVIVQANEHDFHFFWKEFANGHVLFDALRGHLTPDARVIFTGGPALGAMDASGHAAHQEQVPRLLEAYGVPAATFVAALSPVHVAAPKAEAWGRRITTAIGLGLAGAGGVAITYIPREQIWIDYAVAAGGVAWMAGAFVVNHLHERWTDPTYNPKELIDPRDVLRLDQMAIGMGLSALAGGFWYSGTGIVDTKFMIYSAGYGAALLTAYALFERGEQVMAFLRREKRPVNQGRVIRQGDDVAGANTIKMDDPALYSCAGEFSPSK